MRTLRLNEIELWYVRVINTTDNTDIDGNYTGEKVKTYSVPEKVSISMYPSTGNIVNSVAGKLNEFDMIAVSNNVVLEDSDLLFKVEPVSDYDTTYDYKVGSILDSLNSYRYGLTKRV